MVTGDAGNHGVSQNVAVSGEEREALIDDPLSVTVIAKLAIPTTVGVAADLGESRWDFGFAAEGLQLGEREIADADEPHLSAVMQRFHRPPGGPVSGGQAGGLARAVQQVGVDHVGPQVRKRAGERLLDLDTDGSCGIVR